MQKTDLTAQKMQQIQKQMMMSSKVQAKNKKNLLTNFDQAEVQVNPYLLELNKKGIMPNQGIMYNNF